MPKRPMTSTEWILYGRRRVSIFEFLAYQMDASTQQWNKEGLGSVVFKKGTLKLVSSRPTRTYEAETMYIDVNAIKYQRPGDWYEGLTKLQEVLGDKSKMIKIKKIINIILKNH